MNKPHIIAFYLPQYRPVKENNEWFGEGFTEWTNVAKAKPLFKGHQQPKVPADLGFYDLRLPEVREKQAELAKEAGVSAFCYYHYWFGNNKKMLHETLEEVVAAKSPDFPFCICWANHSWYKKNWNPDTRSIEQNLLLEQKYPGNIDIDEHFSYLLPVFKDPRYYRIDGRLVFVVYDMTNMPDFFELKKRWNELAAQNGLPNFYFLAFTMKETEVDNKKLVENTDGVILSMVSGIIDRQNYSKYNNYKRKIKEKISELFHYPLEVYSYSDATEHMLSCSCKKVHVIPTIVPNWDYTARRGAGGFILKDSTPELFKKHVKQALELIKNKPKEKQIVFIKSWNEWGEGNYMEPDICHGKGYIYALKQAIEEFNNQ